MELSNPNNNFSRIFNVNIKLISCQELKHFLLSICNLNITALRSQGMTQGVLDQICNERGRNNETDCSKFILPTSVKHVLGVEEYKW